MRTLSAVVLTYNKAWIFPTFVRCLQEQFRKADQVIVVDDASTDGMPEMLSRLPETWSVVKLTKNLGQSQARNVGYELATGDLIIFLDADIEMKQDMLDVMERTLDSEAGASFAYGHYDRNGTRSDNVRSIPWNAEVLKRGNYISTMSMVRRADLPDPPFDPSLQRYEDWDLWLRMAQSGKRGIFIDRVLFTAHYLPGDLSGVGESHDWYDKVKAKHGFSDTLHYCPDLFEKSRPDSGNGPRIAEPEVRHRRRAQRKRRRR